METRTITMRSSELDTFLKDLMDGPKVTVSVRQGLCLYEVCGSEVRVNKTDSGYAVKITEHEV